MISLQRLTPKKSQLNLKVLIKSRKLFEKIFFFQTCAGGQEEEHPEKDHPASSKKFGRQQNRKGPTLKRKTKSQNTKRIYLTPFIPRIYRTPFPPISCVQTNQPAKWHLYSQEQGFSYCDNLAVSRSTKEFWVWLSWYFPDCQEVKWCTQYESLSKHVEQKSENKNNIN